MCDCGDSPEVWRISRPTARREHSCCECRGLIRPGEAYRSFWGVWDGEAKTYKTCTSCISLDGWMRDGHDCFCPTFGNLHTDALDLVHESGEAALIAECKRRIAEIRAGRRRQAAA